jgi:hypothetical protein
MAVLSVVALYIQLNRTVRTRRTPDFTHRLQISLIGSKDQCDKRTGRKCVHYFDFALDDAGGGGGPKIPLQCKESETTKTSIVDKYEANRQVLEQSQHSYRTVLRRGL